MANEWLSLRLDVMGATIVYMTAMLAIYNKDNISASLLGEWEVGWGGGLLVGWWCSGTPRHLQQGQASPLGEGSGVCVGY